MKTAIVSFIKLLLCVTAFFAMLAPVTLAGGQNVISELVFVGFLCFVALSLGVAAIIIDYKVEKQHA